jgi:hypothetical protein
MTVTFNPNDTLCGVPLGKVRAILWQISDYEPMDVFKIACQKTVQLDPIQVAIILDELTHRGLLTVHQQIGKITPTGNIFLKASDLTPLSSKQARLRLDAFLKTCDLINHYPTNSPLTIKKVWLFGSLLRGQTEVNDIDVVVDFLEDIPEVVDDDMRERTIAFAQSLGFDEVYFQAKKEHVCPWSSLTEQYYLLAIQYIKEEVVFNKQQRLSFENMEALTDLHCPCQLIFDSSRGGMVSNSILTNHPDSLQRHPDMEGTKKLPDFSGACYLSPVNIDFLSNVIPYDTQINCKFPYGHVTRVFYHYNYLGNLNTRLRTVIEQMREKQQDPNDDIVLLQYCRQGHSYTSEGRDVIGVSRSMDLKETYEYTLTLQASCGLEDATSVSALVERLAVIVQADLEKIRLHAMANNPYIPVKVTLNAQDDPSALMMLEHLESLLAKLNFIETLYPLSILFDDRFTRILKAF